MFNYVDTGAICPACGAIVTSWQSKYMTRRGRTIPLTLKRIKLSKSMSGEIHTFCDGCDAWLDWTVTNGEIEQATHSRRKR